MKRSTEVKYLNRRKASIFRKSRLAKRETLMGILFIRMQVINQAKRLPRSRRTRDNEEKMNYS